MDLCGTIALFIRKKIVEIFFFNLLFLISVAVNSLFL